MSRYGVKIVSRDAVNFSNALSRSALTLDRDMTEAERKYATRATVIFAAFAPKRSLRLVRGIYTRVGKQKVDIFIKATDPSSGYNYAPVTRFGHRVQFIYPKNARYLKIPIHGGFIYRKRVRGFHPKHDWAKDAKGELLRELDKTAEEVGRKYLNRVTRIYTK